MNEPRKPIQIEIPQLDHFVVYREEGFEDVVIAAFNSADDADLFIRAQGRENARHYLAAYRSQFDCEIYFD